MTLPPEPLPPRPVNRAHTGRILQTTISLAIMLATLFVAFSPKMFSSDVGSVISGWLTSQQASGQVAITTRGPGKPIGIVSGHWGNGDDPGAVCQDGKNEHDVNLAIASLVRQKLEAWGYQVDLLQEYDPRLEGYDARVLVSIHADTCDYIDEQATGFKVAASTYSRDTNLTSRLTACLYDRYGRVTGLRYHTGSVTLNMTDYHAFSVVAPTTTAAILETGFLNLDRPLLVDHPDVVADGIVAGVLCFVNNESAQPAPYSNP